MNQLPFNPEKAAGGDAITPPARRERAQYGTITDAKHLTVSQVSALITSTLEQRIPSPLRVIGEVSNLSDRNHWYFSLKDAESVLSCVAWASAAKKFKVRPRDGDEIIATGHISHYGPQGRTQFYVSNVHAVGVGTLEARFRALCEELRKLGYFEEARKKPLPVFCRRIAVITARDSAAAADVIATSIQRCKAVGLLMIDVRVQGEGAATQVAHAIRWVDRNRQSLEVDAILVTRGGGSMEDLWAFNERIVADAVLKCSLPLVAAIGHESDTTIIELVADLRAATPTQAIMRLVPDAAELGKQLAHMELRLGFVTRRRVEHARQRLLAVRRHMVFADPLRLFAEARERVGRLETDLRQAIRLRIGAERLTLERLTGVLAKTQPRAILERKREHLFASRRRLHRAGGWFLERGRERITAFERQLAAVDPASVLQRGFSITQKLDGSIVRSVRHVRRGEAMLTRVSDGAIRSLVERADGAAHGPTKGSRRGGTGAAAGSQAALRGDQLDLFAARDEIAPMSAKSKSLRQADPAKLSYEQAIEELESIIERIERGEIALEESLAARKRGDALIKRCRGILDTAEQELKELAAEEEEG